MLTDVKKDTTVLAPQMNHTAHRSLRRKMREKNAKLTLIANQTTAIKENVYTQKMETTVKRTLNVEKLHHARTMSVLPQQKKEKLVLVIMNVDLIQLVEMENAKRCSHLKIMLKVTDNCQLCKSGFATKLIGTESMCVEKKPVTGKCIKNYEKS